MHYQRISELKRLKLESMQDKSVRLTEHLLTHPMDYQARNASIILDSDIEAKKQELGRLDYLVKVQQYK